MTVGIGIPGSWGSALRLLVVAFAVELLAGPIGVAAQGPLLALPCADFPPESPQTCSVRPLDDEPRYPNPPAGR